MRSSSRPVTRQQALEALRQPVPACSHCRSTGGAHLRFIAPARRAQLGTCA
ncbi:DUF6233 domain-containing protein [Streptomyces spiralis]